MTAKTSAPDERQLITLARTLRAPVEKVWKLWTTKEGLEKWWGPEGFTSVVNRIDVRVGGGFEIAMTAVREEIVKYLQSTGAPITSHDRGDYSEVVVHERLAWINGVDFIPGVAKYDSHSSVDMQAEGGGTRIVVTLDSMHDAHWTKMKVMGWEGQLAKLERLLADEVG